MSRGPRREPASVRALRIAALVFVVIIIISLVATTCTPPTAVAPTQ